MYSETNTFTYIKTGLLDLLFNLNILNNFPSVSQPRVCVFLEQMENWHSFSIAFK